MTTASRAVTLGAATLTAAALLAGTVAGSASAAAGDPITGGTTTFAVPADTILGGAVSGVVAVPTSPATISYDQAANAADYAFPVDGGDGSVVAAYGSVEHAGGLVIADYQTKRSVSFTALTFSLETLTVSATPSDGGAPVVLLDVDGTHTFSRNAGTGLEEYTGTDVEIDPAGAAYLDSALHTTAFQGGQHVGSFDTTFTNTQY
ncbi:MAG: hypothetical protein J0H43_14500 [Actinobacteria bacterium]|nr:hypothetical protein [Actinomycetota bacterium]